MIIGKYLSGSSLIDGALFETPLTFPPAADHKGARRLGVDGFVYTSQRFPKDDSPYQWLSASQITAQSIRVIDDDSVTNVTVHPTSPSADFTTLAAAFNYMSGFNPAFGITPIQGSITILSGMQMGENDQIIAANVDLGWIDLLSEDATVTVRDEEMLSPDIFVNSQMPLFGFTGSITPRMRVLFVSNGDSSLDPARVICGMRLRNSFATSAQSAVSLRAGFRGFHLGLVLTMNAGFRGARVDCSLSRIRGGFVTSGGLLYFDRSSDFSGCTDQGVLATTGGTVVCESVGALLSGQHTTFRRDPSADSSQDIVVADGGIVCVIDPDALGGLNQPANRLTYNGRIQDVRVAFSAPYDRSNLLGTVSQTDGVPTGAAMQHGSSANGSFERRASGRAECTRTDQQTPNVSTAYGALFRSADIVWTFPTAFFGGTLPAVSFSANNPDVIGFRIISLSATSVTFQLVANASIAGTTTVRASAHGRWSVMA